MKIKKFLLALMAACLLCPMLSACGDDDDPAEKNNSTESNEGTEQGAGEKDEDTDKKDPTDDKKDPADDKKEPTEEKKDETKMYVMEYVFADDFLELFNVKITKTVGTTETTYSLSKSKTVTDDTDTWSGKTTGIDRIEVGKDTPIKIEASITLKSNWKDIVASKSKLTLKMAQARAESEKDFNLSSLGGVMDADKVYEELLYAFANSFVDNIKFSK